MAELNVNAAQFFPGGSSPDERSSFIQSGPGVPHETPAIKPKNVDIHSTVLNTFGVAAPADLDGQVLGTPPADPLDTMAGPTEAAGQDPDGELRFALPQVRQRDGHRTKVWRPLRAGPRGSARVDRRRLPEPCRADYEEWPDRLGARGHSLCQADLSVNHQSDGEPAHQPE